MASVAKVTGADKVIANLGKAKNDLGSRTERALLLAGLKLQAESQKLVPVNTGHLKASAYTRSSGKGLDTVVSVGYTASYAIFVHEAVGMVLKGKPRPHGQGRFWDPQGKAQAKFLEEPARRLRPQLFQIIQKAMKI